MNIKRTSGDRKRCVFNLTYKKTRSMGIGTMTPSLLGPSVTFISYIPPWLQWLDLFFLIQVLTRCFWGQRYLIIPDTEIHNTLARVDNTVRDHILLCIWKVACTMRARPASWIIEFGEAFRNPSLENNTPGLGEFQSFFFFFYSHIMTLCHY